MSENENKEKNEEYEETVEYISDEYDEYEGNVGCDGENICEHTFEVDLFDIDSDRAQQITYCTKCFFILQH